MDQETAMLHPLVTITLNIIQILISDKIFSGYKQVDVIVCQKIWQVITGVEL